MKIKNILVLITLVICTQLYAQSDNNSGLITNNLDNQKKELELIKDDYQNGKQLISEYYDLVYKAIEKGKLELFEDAISKVKRANTLLGHAYTKEKAYQNSHPEYYNPVSLQEYKHWVALSEELTTGSHIKTLQALVKQNEVAKSKLTPFTESPNTQMTNRDFWIYGNTESCSEFYPISDCSNGCLKMKVCVISETDDKVTLKVEVLPTNISTCFGSSNNDPIKIFYGYEKTEVSRSIFKKEGFRTEAFTIPKEFDNGQTVWNSKIRLFKTANGKYVSSPFFIVWC